jgi:hypothetical protein
VRTKTGSQQGNFVDKTAKMNISTQVSVRKAEDVRPNTMKNRDVLYHSLSVCIDYDLKIQVQFLSQSLAKNWTDTGYWSLPARHRSRSGEAGGDTGPKRDTFSSPVTSIEHRFA